MKNLSLYILGFIVIILGIVYLNIPTLEKNVEGDLKTEISKNNSQFKKTPIKLSQLEEQNYKILNDRIVKLTKQIEILKNSSNLNGEFEKIYQEVEKLKAQNEQLSLKNNELNNRLSNEVLLVNENSKNSYEKMIDKLNEDLANYKSENDSLKLSLNDKENAVKNLNSLIGTLSNQKQMDEFEHDNLARKLQEELDKANAKIEANKKNYSDLVSENNVLKQRIGTLEKLENSNIELNKINNELNFKNIELTKEIRAANKLNEGLKTSQNADFEKLNMDNKNLQAKLEDAKTTILKLNQFKNDLEAKLSFFSDVEKQRDSLKDEVFNIKLKLEKNKNEQAKIFEDLNEKSKKSLDKIAKDLAEVNEKNAILQEKNVKNELILREIQLKNKDLESSYAQKDKELKEALSKLKKSEEVFNLSNNASEEFKTKISELQKEKINLVAELNKVNDEFLKYKNQSLNNKKSDIENLNVKLLENLKAYDELNASFIALKEDYSVKELELSRLVKDKAGLENEVEQLKLAINNDRNYEKIIMLEDEKEQLLRQLSDLNSKTLKNYNQENNELAEKKVMISKLQKELEMAQKGSVLNTTNLKLVDTYICDSIKSGVIGLNKTCSLELDKFLSKYKENYLYEITPIVDNGGFRSLSAIDGVYMDSAEVKRLTRLANFGLSKDRTKSAASFIKSKIPNALISASLEPEYSKNGKKGFILRVYK